jgi:endonuclease/exonuclease/phosphatase (EEP) superfamily protein YafD
MKTQDKEGHLVSYKSFCLLADIHSVILNYICMCKSLTCFRLLRAVTVCRLLQQHLFACVTLQIALHFCCQIIT